MENGLASQILVSAIFHSALDQINVRTLHQINIYLIAQSGS